MASKRKYTGCSKSIGKPRAERSTLEYVFIHDLDRDRHVQKVGKGLNISKNMFREGKFPELQSISLPMSLAMTNKAISRSNKCSSRPLTFCR
ncbi:unnamed protein product [Acanthoscelides obtectus]|uniref:Uncharacterized protein n=1 Tax=Acanthoscelides obtectus TaxID=200917 RepID=A0A9P0LH00_ACAOB|nr:unnamed protein product [Acanthoscelides obtectus]CAK1656841.1 hypothetical protein AOBTE_LOCUS19952 [Acanthoscelides obtectus]